MSKADPGANSEVFWMNFEWLLEEDEQTAMDIKRLVMCAPRAIPNPMPTPHSSDVTCDIGDAVVQAW